MILIMPIIMICVQVKALSKEKDHGSKTRLHEALLARRFVLMSALGPPVFKSHIWLWVKKRHP